MNRASAVILAMAGFVWLGTATTHAQPYGPDTCKQGYVWREAFPGDHVCVTPEVRAQTARDNSEANARRQPGGGPYGPDTCQRGFVWRDARPGDHVCVTPQTRDAAAADNRQASGRLAVGATSDRTFERPRYRDERLDRCLTWGANCGAPAAQAFCHRWRFEDAAAFAPEHVGRSARTRLISADQSGSDQTCDGDACTAFRYITCTRPVPYQRVFANPANGDRRLDVCLQWATNCGKPVADAFCKQEGFSDALYFVVDPETGYAPTRLIGTNQVCTSGCRGFQEIICR